MTILEMSLSGAVLIAAILMLRRVLLYRVPKWTFLLLWAVALGRLLIPFALPSQFSVYTAAVKAAQYFEEEAPAASSEICPSVADPKPFREDGWTVPTAPTAPIAPIPMPEKKPVSPVTAIYLTGVSLFGLFFAAAYLWGLRRFREAEPVKSDFLSRWQAGHPTLLPVEIKSCVAVNAPLAYGLLKPVVLLPQNTDWSDESQLTCVLIHEYVHIRRGDLGWKLLLTAALCVHWFNPFVWAMYLQANRDLELACDEAVVRTLGLNSRKRYACSLLSAAESGFSPLCITFTAKNHMEERIRAIMKMKRTSVAAVLTAALLVTGVTTVFATSKAPEPLKIDNLPQAVQGDPLPDPAPAPEKDDPAPDTSIPSSQPTPTQAPEPVAEPVELAAKPAEGTPQPQEPVQMEPTSSTLENRWGVPDGEIPQWTELTAASFEDAHALGQYLETVHGLYPGDYTTGRSNGIVTVQITYSERAIRERLPDGVYPVNSKGETYGRAIDSEVVGYDPDLILVQATNGESGYAFNRDLSYGGYPGEINNPDDAMAYMEWRKTQPNTILIPVYDVDRNNIIGYFGLSNSSDMTPGEELEIVKAHMRQSMDMAE